MKAISPALPMTTPSRHATGADSSSDQTFGALIAAVIGAPAARPTPDPVVSSSRSSTSGVDKADDARRAAADHRSSRSDETAYQAGAKAAAGEQADAADNTEPVKAPGNADDKETANSAASKAASSGAAKAVQPATTSPNGAMIPAGLEKAATALAQALATSADASAKTPAAKAVSATPAASVAGLTTLPATQPGTALTEGQLPTQLVAVVANAHAEHGASFAVVTATTDAEQKTGTPPGGQPKAQAAPAIAGQPKVDASKSVLAHDATAAGSQATQPQASSEVVSSAAAAPTLAATTAGSRQGVDAKASGPQPPASGDNSAPQLGAPPSPPLAPVTTPTQVVQVAPPQPAQPAYSSGLVSQQIVQVVAPLRTAKDGDYTLSLQLHPAELGPVTVRVDVQQGVLSVQLTADHSHGRDALNQSLADLRTQLQSNGVRTGDIVVAARPSLMPQYQQDQQHHTGGRHQQEAPMHDDAGADRRPNDRTSRRAPTPADDDNLDVRI